MKILVVKNICIVCRYPLFNFVILCRCVSWWTQWRTPRMCWEPIARERNSSFLTSLLMVEPLRYILNTDLENFFSRKSDFFLSCWNGQYLNWWWFFFLESLCTDLDLIHILNSNLEKKILEIKNFQIWFWIKHHVKPYAVFGTKVFLFPELGVYRLASHNQATILIWQ